MLACAHFDVIVYGLGFYLFAKLWIDKCKIFQGQKDPIGTLNKLDLLESPPVNHVERRSGNLFSFFYFST